MAKKKKSKPPKKTKKAAKPRAKVQRRKRSPSRKKKAARGTTPSAKATIHQGVGLARRARPGDDQGLSAVEDVDSESVSELVDEGQAFEAEVVDGVERAADADESEVKTHEVPEDDVPDEYRNPREQED